MATKSPARNNKPKKWARARPLPPDVNARNLAIEKQRREAMNENFLELAQLVPSIGTTQRLTKVLVVTKTIEHLKEQQNICIAVSQDMQNLLEENRRLVMELNMLRAQLHPEFETPLAAAAPITGAMAQFIEASDRAAAPSTPQSPYSHLQSLVVAEMANLNATTHQSLELPSSELDTIFTQPYPSLEAVCQSTNMLSPDPATVFTDGTYLAFPSLSDWEIGNCVGGLDLI